MGRYSSETQQPNTDDHQLLFDLSNSNKLQQQHNMNMNRSTSLPTNLTQSKKNNSNKKKKNQVLLQGYVGESSSSSEDDLKRTKSLTDDDLDELKGCLDLGFGFSYEEIPELCNTLPALELCYSMSQKYHEDQHNNNSDVVASESSGMSSPIANWKISSPGDHPEDVKARLKYWAQAVACTVQLCS
ncbi:hypothetical protein ACFE04_008665 [Oxalis oulophora]